MMGAFWFLSGVITVILNEGILFYLYMPTGLGMMIYGYLIRNKTEEYISWNHFAIIVKDLANEELSYAWQDVDAMFISNNHLTLKLGAANGIILTSLDILKRTLNYYKLQLRGILNRQLLLLISFIPLFTPRLHSHRDIPPARCAIVQSLR